MGALWMGAWSRHRVADCAAGMAGSRAGPRGALAAGDDGRGVLTYFALHDEPPAWTGVALLLPAALGGAVARRGSLLRGVLVSWSRSALGCVRRSSPPGGPPRCSR